MATPGGADDRDVVASSVRIGAAGHLEVAPGAATAADARLESVCAELGILLARDVEPVSVRVLPFGEEQLAMVQVLDSTGSDHQLLAATARGNSPSEAVAGAAVRAMTGGHNVLEAALPGAVADGKVRSAVVFSEGDAPVRWGEAGDEGRLAALYAVIPQLGSFTATTGTDTYRVLRLPGIGVALVSEGASAAAWVEGWFAALLHATQFALRSTQRTTSVVATGDAGAAGGSAARSGAEASMLARLEDESRRILQAAQDQAAEIRAAAERDAARLQRDDDERGPRRDGSGDRRHDRDAASRLEDATRESERVLHDAERTRDRLVADARREIDSLRRETERACESMLADARRECEELRRDAERARTAMIADANRHAEQARQDAAANLQPAARGDRRDDVERRQRPDDVIREARRAADDLLHDARRTAEEIVRDATRTRERLVDEQARRAGSANDGGAPRDVQHAWVRGDAVPDPVAQPVSTPQATVAAPVPEASSPPAPTQPASSAAAPTAEEARLAAMALLTAAAESISAMSVILGRAATAPQSPSGGPDDADPFDDVPGLFFGA